MKLKNSHGMTLTEVVIISAVVVTIVAFSGGVVQRLFTDKAITRFSTQMYNLRDNYVALLRDNRSWNATVTNGGANFNCVRNHTTCSAFTAFRDFVPRDVNGAAANGYSYTAVPAANTNHGFTKEGVMCTGYSTATPNEGCPVQIRFQWRSLCDTAGCIDSNVELTMAFSFSFPDSSSLRRVNPIRFSMTSAVAAPPAPQPLPPLVRLGSPNVLNPTATCAGTNVIVGYNSSGNPICASAASLVPNSCRFTTSLGTSRVVHGQMSSNIFYVSSSVPCGSTCTRATVRCVDGAAVPNRPTSCSVAACPPPVKSPPAKSPPPPK